MRRRRQRGPGLGTAGAPALRPARGGGSAGVASAPRRRLRRRAPAGAAEGRGLRGTG